MKIREKKKKTKIIQDFNIGILGWNLMLESYVGILCWKCQVFYTYLKYIKINSRKFKDRK